MKYLRLAALQNSLDLDLHEFELLASECLDKPIYSKESVLAELEVNEDEFERHFLSANTKHLQEFKLRQRALHVIQGITNRFVYHMKK